MGKINTTADALMILLYIDLFDLYREDDEWQDLALFLEAF